MPDRSKPIAIVVHQAQSRPGRVGALLEQKGYRLERFCPTLGCCLPEDPGRFAGVIVFGGPMSANDCDTICGIRRELAWIPKVLDAGVPYLGICLGAQQLARVVGGRVYEHPEGKAEIGYYPVRPTEAGRAWIPEPMHVYQWHREGFDVPASCEVLAEGEIFANQAFRYGETAFGIQFHPEVTLEMKEIWTVRAAHRLTMPGARPRAEHLGFHPYFDPQLGAWIDGFLDRWLASGRAASSNALALAAE